MPAAVVFDLDGVLLDSEQRWNEAKEALVREAGGRWRDEAPNVMMGMSSGEWSAYLRDQLGVAMAVEEINRDVVRRMRDGYRRELPLLPGAEQAVRALAAHWPLGLASSSNREVIDLALELANFGDAFRVTVSSEEVERGKPAADVYLEAARRLGVDAAGCVAIEDSGNGLRAAAAAGMTVIAVPNPHYPPGDEPLALAAVTVATVGEVTPALVEQVGPPARYRPSMASNPTLVVEIPRGGTVDQRLRDEPPASVAGGDVAVVRLAANAAGRIDAPDAGEVVMSVLAPEALLREREELRRVIDRAGTGDEALVVVVEAAEELREDELAAALDAARHSRRSVILRIAGPA